MFRIVAGAVAALFINTAAAAQPLTAQALAACAVFTGYTGLGGPGHNLQLRIVGGQALYKHDSANSVRGSWTPDWITAAVTAPDTWGGVTVQTKVAKWHMTPTFAGNGSIKGLAGRIHHTNGSLPYPVIFSCSPDKQAAVK